MSLEKESLNLSEHIKKAKEGVQTSFNYLLDTFWNDVFNFQLKRTQNEYEAEDITIQSFSRAFDKIDTFKEGYNFKTWLIQISKNIHIDLLRKKNASIRSKTTTEVDDSLYTIIDDAPTPEDKLITEQNLAQLLRYIKQLKPHYQEVINLRYFQELSYKEISEVLDEPMNNVKVKLLRARKLLAEIITAKKEN
ncbi:RNA polymerase sigma factor [Aquimarina sp. 2201CG14-23]|uniref:RNA polymerase sigma factor n=1 Tax=Aquimarina mycalae TaxID=3040073 RepID=UPI0024780919|nr:sigma-70 family RNA polymerase sigma factor [Aquimarina sp. 2201CG14-23]MDH7444601.1 sigma-70 family RNA polymerase sigma factor [Aquimarina sp. 2201CG14-23]